MSMHFQKAAVPTPPLPHSISTPSLVAQIMYQKYALGLPLARQEKDWFRMGLFNGNTAAIIQRATILYDWQPRHECVKDRPTNNLILTKTP